MANTINPSARLNVAATRAQSRSVESRLDRALRNHSSASRDAYVGAPGGGHFGGPHYGGFGRFGGHRRGLGGWGGPGFGGNFSTTT